VYSSIVVNWKFSSPVVDGIVGSDFTSKVGILAASLAKMQETGLNLLLSIDQ
jgi:hypothetical protein